METQESLVYHQNELKIYEPSVLQDLQMRVLDSPSEDTSVWFPIPREGEVSYESRIDIDSIDITTEYVDALNNYLDRALDDFTGFSKPKCDGFVVALSGGLDSAVSTELLNKYCKAKGCNLKILVMGEGDHNEYIDRYLGTPAEWIDIQYAKLMCQENNLDFEYLDITRDIKALRDRYTKKWAISGQLPRLRANHLYAMAEEHDLISVGTTNGSEYILAAFSTGGPAGNIAPLLDLYKTEVYAIARDIGIPKYIQERMPLINELNLPDNSFYGRTVDSTILDPIIRRLWFHKQNPIKVAKELGHSERWVRDIDEKRIKGESCRRNYKGLLINRGFHFEDLSPDLFVDRSYFI